MPLLSQYWEKVNSIPAPYNNNYWLDVYFLPGNSNYGWICGFNGMILRTTDGGRSWAGDSILGAYHLESIHFPTSTIGYTSGVDGIWKSTNSGQTWFDIKPIQAGDSLNFWGNYFFDANNGVVVGMGCGGSRQFFWKTTNGGTTWTYSNGNEFDSGLTDAILSAGGLGYASSSGKIWRTTDSGNNWSVMASTGTNLWQEELGYFNQSFVVPYAGDNCQGGGSTNGGMRFSTDGGINWIDRNVGRSMFGTFILSETEAWACGYNESVYHTTNAGQNWTLRNCGILPGNMDDLWFISSNNGWVVGEGVYKYSTGKQTISKTLVDFKDGCIGIPRYDTLFIDNFNFNTVAASWQLQGANPNDFNIITPTQSFSLLPCGAKMFVIEFNPSSAGIKTADLRIDITGYPTQLVGLYGKAVKPSTSPADTLVIADSIVCGTTKILTIKWKSDSDVNNEFINSSSQTGSNDISIATQLPLKVTQLGVDTKFTVVPSDTGWQTARFTFRLFPCNIDTFVTIRFFGLSPIINSTDYVENNAECVLITNLEVPVANTGNDKLNISNLEILAPVNGFSVIGWKSGFPQPRILKPGEIDTIIVSYAPLLPGIRSAKLRISNNDKTTVRGKMNPYDVELNAGLIYTNVSTRDTIVDLGEICVGDSNSILIKIANDGNLDALLNKIDISEQVFKFLPKNQIYPIKISQFDTLEAFVRFVPDTPGYFEDTIVISSSPCEELLKICVKGKGISSSASLSPQVIAGTVYNYASNDSKVTIQNDGSEDLTINSYSFNPPLSDWNISITPTLPQIIKPNESMEFMLTFSTQQDSALITQICFEADAGCPIEICSDINYKSVNDPITFEPDPLDFGEQICDVQTSTRKIQIKNLSAEPTRVDNIYIEPANSDFTIASSPNFPLTIAVGKYVEIEIAFTPSNEGISSAELVADGEISSIRAVLTGEFKKSILSPSSYSHDFGDFERCEAQVSQSFVFYNKGLLDDTLDIGLDANCICYSLDKNSAILPSMDSVEITLFFNPADGIKGINQNKAVISSRTCGETSEIILSAAVNEPDLVINPSILEFLNVWPGDTLTQDITLENRSAFEINILSLNIPSIQNIYEIDKITPFIIPSGGFETFSVRFIGLVTGIYYDSLEINYNSACNYDSLLSVTSSVSSEVYKIQLSISDYIEEPYKDFSFNIILDNEVPKFRPDSLTIELSFDPWLFVPSLASFITDVSSIEIPSILQPGFIQLSVPKEFADTMFLKSGVKFTIDGFTYPSSPNVTEIAFDKVDISTDKTLDLETNDGSLTINPVCHPIGKLHMTLMGTITLRIMDEVITDNILELDIESSKQSNATVSIFGINGEKFKELLSSFNSGTNLLHIDLSNLASGTYYFVINSSTGQVFTKKFIVLN